MENDLILVVDDDEKICQVLTLYLRSKGFEVVVCKSGKRAMSVFRECNPKLVLLDIMLPGMDGWEILAKIRKISNAPVIMLTAKGDTSDRVQGLDCGADDYIVKPFDSKELIARIRAVLRRSALPDEPAPNRDKHIILGDLEIDPKNYLILRNGRQIEMPPKEIELFVYFINHENSVLSRGELLDGVWGFEFYGDSRTVDVHVKRIRDRLGESKYWRIRTVWSVGYKFERLEPGN